MIGDRQTIPSQYNNNLDYAVHSTYTRPPDIPAYTVPAELTTTTYTYVPPQITTSPSPYPTTYTSYQPTPLLQTTYTDNPYNFGVIRTNETKRTATFGQLPSMTPTKVSLNYVSPTSQFVSSQVTRQY